jgi:hypothetical protein
MNLLKDGIVEGWMIRQKSLFVYTYAMMYI